MTLGSDIKCIFGSYLHSPAPAAGISVVAGINVDATVVDAIGADAIAAAGNKKHIFFGLAVKGKPFCVPDNSIPPLLP